MVRKLRSIREYESEPESQVGYPCKGCAFYEANNLSCPTADCSGIIWVETRIQDEEIIDGGCA